MTITTSEAGKALAAARELKTKQCAVCSKSFVTIGRGVYCSNACRQRAKVARKKIDAC